MFHIFAYSFKGVVELRKYCTGPMLRSAKFDLRTLPYGYEHLFSNFVVDLLTRGLASFIDISNPRKIKLFSRMN